MNNSAKILILGKTHVGKSSFINYFLGKDVAKTGVGKPITQELTAYSFDDWNYPVEIFDSKGIEAKTADEQVKDIISEVKKRNNDDDIFNWFHTIFYCCSAEKRFEDFEANFINRLEKEISQHIHIILTKCDCVESDVISVRKEYIKGKINDENFEIFEIVSVDGELYDGTIAEKKGKEAVAERVFDLLWKDIANKISARYAEALSTEFVRIADVALTNANKAIDETIKLNSLVTLFQEDGEAVLEQKLDDAQEEFEKNLRIAINKTNEKFNDTIKPLAELYSSYKGIVTDSFAENANMLFDDAFDWVNTDWMDNVDDAYIMKILTPALAKNGFIDEYGNFDDFDDFDVDNVRDAAKVLKAIALAAYDILGLKKRLKRLCKDFYDAFIESIPFEEDLQKCSYDRLIEAVNGNGAYSNKGAEKINQYTARTQAELADSIGEIIKKELDKEGKALLTANGKESKIAFKDNEQYEIYLSEGDFSVPYHIKQGASFLEEKPNIKFIGVGNPKVYVPHNRDDYDIQKAQVIEDISFYENIWREEAEQGSAAAQYEMGCYYAVEGNYNRHIEWTEMSAKSGYILSQLFMGTLYHIGVSDTDFYLEKDNEKAYQFILAALEQKCEMARAVLKDFYYADMPEDKSERFKWDSKFAEYEIADAQFSLGRQFQCGGNVEKNISKAFELYMKAAVQGYAKAQNAVGNCYYHGGGTKQDYNEAFSWYLKAAEQGNPFAQNNVAVCFRDGKGVKRNKDEADKWLSKCGISIDLNRITLK